MFRALVLLTKVTFIRTLRNMLGSMLQLAFFVEFASISQLICYILPSTYSNLCHYETLNIRLIVVDRSFGEDFPLSVGEQNDRVFL